MDDPGVGMEYQNQLGSAPSLFGHDAFKVDPQLHRRQTRRKQPTRNILPILPFRSEWQEQEKRMAGLLGEQLRHGGDSGLGFVNATHFRDELLGDDQGLDVDSTEALGLTCSA